MIPFRSGDARRLAAALTAEDVPIPAPLAAAVRLGDNADKARQQPTVRALDLDADAVRAHAQALVLHDERLFERLAEIADQGAREAAVELRADGLDPVIEALRPAFDAAAAVVTEAAKLGITSTTTAAEIIERDDPRVVDAWRNMKPAIARLNEIASLRVMLSTVLGVSPTLGDVQNAAGSALDVTAVDYSAAFVEPASGGFTVDGGAYLGRRPTGGLDWLRLSGAGLRLNSVGEVRAMFADRAATALNIPLDQNPRAVLAREHRTAHPDDQTVYAR